MAKEKVTTNQNIYLGLEVETSVKLIELGFKELQKINESNDFYFLPFLLLSSGFERMMKCMICFKSYKDHGIFPTQEQLKTHDLVKLKNNIISDCISHNTISKSEGLKKDFDFLKQDNELKEILFILSEFGKNSRYYNLDIVTGATNPSKDVKKMWEEYETKMMKSDPDLRSHFSKNRLDKFYKRLNQIIISKLEYFTRALVRQFTLGDLGIEAKRYTGTISRFLFLMDTDLGNTTY